MAAVVLEGGVVFLKGYEKSTVIPFQYGQRMNVQDGECIEPGLGHGFKIQKRKRVIGL